VARTTVKCALKLHPCISALLYVWSLQLSHLELSPDELAGYLEKQGKEEEGASLWVANSDLSCYVAHPPCSAHHAPLLQHCPPC
jgi:hypothetical protein